MAGIKEQVRQLDNLNKESIEEQTRYALISRSFFPPDLLNCSLLQVSESNNKRGSFGTDSYVGEWF